MLVLISSSTFYLLSFASFTNEITMYIIFWKRAAAVGGLPSREIDRWWEESNPSPSRPKPTTLSAWLPPKKVHLLGAKHRRSNTGDILDMKRLNLIIVKTNCGSLEPPLWESRIAQRHLTFMKTILALYICDATSSTAQASVNKTPKYLKMFIISNPTPYRVGGDMSVTFGELPTSLNVWSIYHI